MPIPADLVLELKAAHRVRTFVETGTYLGTTAAWAARHFERVVTVEASRALYDQARGRLAQMPNVEIVFGDSRTQLPAIVHGLAGPAIFWLDGHWSGEETYGADDECPLLAEIAIIVAGGSHLIFIDDARLFLSAPPRPHRAEAWPTAQEVFDALSAGRERPHIAVFEDVIVAVPPGARGRVTAYCQESNTRAWAARVEEGRGLRGGVATVAWGLREIGAALSRPFRRG